MVQTFANDTAAIRSAPQESAFVQGEERDALRFAQEGGAVGEGNRVVDVTGGQVDRVKDIAHRLKYLVEKSIDVHGKGSLVFKQVG